MKLPLLEQTNAFLLFLWLCVKKKNKKKNNNRNSKKDVSVCYSISQQASKRAYNSQAAASQTANNQPQQTANNVGDGWMVRLLLAASVDVDGIQQRTLSHFEAVFCYTSYWAYRGYVVLCIVVLPRLSTGRHNHHQQQQQHHHHHQYHHNRYKLTTITITITTSRMTIAAATN